jgi:hypothetical protein
MGEFVRESLPDPVAYFEAQGLKLDGRGKWRTTRCDFHDGSDSMRINTASGGWVCMSCGAKGGDLLSFHMQRHGLDFIDAAKGLGYWQEDGRPSAPQRPKPLPASAALQVLAFESLLTFTAAANIARGIQLTDIDRTRLNVAAQRINAISEAFA